MKRRRRWLWLLLAALLVLMAAAIAVLEWPRHRSGAVIPTEQPRQQPGTCCSGRSPSPAMCWAHYWRTAMAFDCGHKDKGMEEQLLPGVFRAPAQTSDVDGVSREQPPVEVTIYRDGLVIVEGGDTRIFRYRCADWTGDPSDWVSRLWLCPYPAGGACRWATFRSLPPTPSDADPPDAKRIMLPELLGDRVLVRDVPLLQFPLPIPSWRPAEPLPPLEVGEEPAP